MPQYPSTGGSSPTLADLGVTATAAELNALHNVKVYRALLSQSGTDAPTAVIQENSLGGVPTLARTSTGLYTLTLTGAFPTASKVWLSPDSITNADGTTIKIVRTDANTITITVLEETADLGGSMYFVLYVYP